MDRHIIVIEDCEDLVASLQIALEGTFSCPVTLVADGAAAMRLIEAREDAASAIVTDLNLPGADGWEIVARLRQDPKWRETAIVVISADTDPRTPARVLASGADAFFPKPYSPAEVCRCLEKILHEKDMSHRSVASSRGSVRPESNPK